jgi:SAM-dependent methyltransferase
MNIDCDKYTFLNDYYRDTYDFSQVQSQLIANILLEHGKGERVLDLGCGPVLPILSLFLPQAVHIQGIDRLEVTADFVSQRLMNYEIDKPVASALKYLKTKNLHAPAANLLTEEDEKNYLVNRWSAVAPIKTGSVLDVHSEFIEKFDVVIQIGCFGTLQSREEFHRATYLATSYLRRGGTLIMATWAQDIYKERPFQFNSALSTEINESFYSAVLNDIDGLTDAEVRVFNDLGPTSKERGYNKIVYSAARKA